MTTALLKTTALFSAHQKLGAKLVEFGGWNMPVHYTSIVDEHRAVRQAAGVFDISHMGEFFISGASSISFLNSLLTNDIQKLAIGQGQYTLMLNEQGGVIDDLIVYRLAEEEFLLIVNAAKIEEDEAWIRARLDHIPLPVTATTSSDELPAKLSFHGTAHFENRSGTFSALALQGPHAVDVAKTFFGATWAEKIPGRNEIAHASWNCQDILVARTGYTGEDGFEFFFANEIAESLLFALLEAGAPLGLKPAGLGARDTLRLEAGLPLNGNDLSPTRTPLEAGLGFFVSLGKSANFVGRNNLEHQKENGTAEKLAAFRVLEGPPPRAHYAVMLGDERIGEVTSGVPSPTLGYGIGLAYLRADFASLGTKLELEVRGRRVPIEIVRKPFYKRISTFGGTGLKEGVNINSNSSILDALEEDKDLVS